MREPIHTDADLADQVKTIIREARGRFLWHDAHWKMWQLTPARMEPLMEQARLCADAIGYREGESWEMLTAPDQAEIARTLLSRPYCWKAVNNLKTPGATNTGVAAIDKHLNLKVLKNFYHSYYDGVNQSLLEEFSFYTGADMEQATIRDQEFPVNPEELTTFALEHIRTNGNVPPEDWKLIETFAKSRDIPLTSEYPLKARWKEYVAEREKQERQKTQDGWHEKRRW